MPYGYNGKILHVNLNDLSHEVEVPTDKFYRTYFGGAGLADRDAEPAAVALLLVDFDDLSLRHGFILSMMLIRFISTKG